MTKGKKKDIMTKGKTKGNKTDLKFFMILIITCISFYMNYSLKIENENIRMENESIVNRIVSKLDIPEKEVKQMFRDDEISMDIEDYLEEEIFYLDFDDPFPKRTEGATWDERTNGNPFQQDDLGPKEEKK